MSITERYVAHTSVTHTSVTFTSIRARSARVLFTITLLSAIGILLTTSVQSQTRFVTPDTAIDVSRYTTVEQCMSLRGRLNTREVRQLPYWQDTVELTNSEKRYAYPTPVSDTLAMCGSKFSANDVNYNNYSEYADWITFFYDVGRDDEAMAIINVMLNKSEWDLKDTTGRHNVIPYILSAIQAAKPLRWDTFLKIAKSIDDPDAEVPWYIKAEIYSMLFNLASDMNDTAVQHYAAEKTVAIEKTLSPQDKRSTFWSWRGRHYSLQAMEFIHHAEMLDSLRANAKAYVAFRNAYWENIRGENSDKLPDNVGETAQPLSGDFGFKRVNDTVIRITDVPVVLPKEGKPNMIVFLEISCESNTPAFRGKYHRDYNGGAACLPLYTILKRIHKRFPETEIAVVSMTDGFIGRTQPLSPEEEAVQKSDWWLNTHKLPATLVISEQKFFRLPLPDGRRVDEQNDNISNYLFKPRYERIPSGMTYLVDVDGTILHSSSLNRWTEKKFSELLGTIGERR